uniref:Uncharacterized protein n=1 Tax=Meloidogyne enterolobii TaxID=390850 RepID=A0A6V7YBQ2_MELEN|nr:unnamed protein product [Meloidogyne enterolobii]
MELLYEDLREFTIHNTILAVGSPIIYLIFSFSVFFKARELLDSVSKEEKMVKILYYTSILNNRNVTSSDSLPEIRAFYTIFCLITNLKRTYKYLL